MQAMVFREAHGPLMAEQRTPATVRGAEVRVRVLACAVCRTDLHVQDAELPNVPYPIVPGHQVVGEVEAAGPRACLQPGDRVGVTWLGWACGECPDCARGEENLCSRAQFTGYHRDGGFAESLIADSRFCIPIDASLPAAETTPLLCAGLIGYRSLRMAGDAQRIGIYGFGSAAHIITQVAVGQSREIYAFTRAGDVQAQAFAKKLGAVWAGDSETAAPVPLDAALIFAPVGSLVPKALRDVRRGGRVVCGGIHMSDIPSFPYVDLWGERRIQSVANLTREDGREFMRIASQIEVRPTIKRYSLGDANRALDDLRSGAINGSAVLVMEEP
ncbi:MAG: zinc-dependent alcohol dehydrogenase family protein [bacterium]|nr:zinc-dependent alcohol dehydrogenase family protein [bacterium]